MKYTLLWLLLIISMVSCIKPKNNPKPPELPPATQEGKNTIGFRLNGEIWLPKVPMFQISHSGSYYKGSLQLTATRNITEDNLLESININILTQEVGTYILKDWGKPYSKAGAQFSKYKPQREYITDSIHTGTIHITRFDTINRIYSGTFEMQVHNDSLGTLYITDGRFDFKQ